MDDAEKSKPLINWSAVGPVITVLITAAGMFVGFGAVIEGQKSQAKEIATVSARVDKLYDLLIYPNIGPRVGSYQNGNP